MESPFLDKDIILENDNSFAIYDGFPVSKGHCLVIPKKIVHSIFELDQKEYLSLFELVRDVRKILMERFTPNGFNIGVNNGEAAGQTVKHAHVHVIPRYYKDVFNPRGGVRNVIPDKADYLEIIEDE